MTFSFQRLILIGSILILPTAAFSATLGDWQFNDGTGGTALDSSGLNKHGTLIAFGNLFAAAGNNLNSGWTSDGRLAFDGTDDYVSTPLSLPSLQNRSFTLEAIASHDNPTQTWSPILGQSNPADQGIFFFGKRADQDRLHYRFGNLSDDIGVSFADGALHHLALVYVYDDPADPADPFNQVNTNSITVFVDYVQQFQRTGFTDQLSMPGNLLIGAVGHAGNERWNGTADRIRISDEALDVAQFVAIPEPTTGLLALAGLVTLAGSRRRVKRS